MEGGLWAGAKGGSQPSEALASGSGGVSTLTSISRALSQPSELRIGRTQPEGTVVTVHLGEPLGRESGGEGWRGNLGGGRRGKVPSPHGQHPLPGNALGTRDQQLSTSQGPPGAVMRDFSVEPWLREWGLAQALGWQLGVSWESVALPGTNGMTVLHLDQILPAFSGHVLRS